MSVYVGLDCGGSSSRVMAVDEGGSVLFQGQSGAANLVSTPENRLRKNLTHATNGCPPATHVCGCFAGLISEDVRTRGLDHLRALFPSAVVRAEPDYTAALFASPTETDICVIAGTGSLVCSRDGDRIVKSGGRGFILGDAGSAYQYGRDALTFFLDYPDQASDVLRNQVLDVFGTNEEPTIVGTIYKAQTPATILSKLAKSLGSDAKNGAPYALRSIARQSEALAGIVASHAKRNLRHKSSLNITLAGGLWRISPLFREGLETHLAASLPNVDVHLGRIVRPPLHGAVELARQMKELSQQHGN